MNQRPFQFQTKFIRKRFTYSILSAFLSEHEEFLCIFWLLKPRVRQWQFVSKLFEFLNDSIRLMGFLAKLVNLPILTTQFGSLEVHQKAVFFSDFACSFFLYFRFYSSLLNTSIRRFHLKRLKYQMQKKRFWILKIEIFPLLFLKNLLEKKWEWILKLSSVHHENISSTIKSQPESIFIKLFLLFCFWKEYFNIIQELATSRRVLEL